MPSAIELSNFAGLGAFCLLGLNLLLGLLISLKYNPVRDWPRRRIKTMQIHDWTAYGGLALSILHPIILTFSSTAHFTLIDIVYPVNAPKQPVVNVFGALALYVLIFVVVTSYLWRHQGVMHRRLWKTMHYANYVFFPLFGIHSILTEPALKDEPIDWFDGEKVLVEVGTLVLFVAIVWRLRRRLHEPAPRVHRTREEIQLAQQK